MITMAGGLRFDIPRTNDQIDTVLTVGITGSAVTLIFGLLAEATHVPFFGIELAKMSLGIFSPIYLVWMLYRFYWNSPGRQTTLSEYTDYKTEDPK